MSRRSMLLLSLFVLLQAPTWAFAQAEDVPAAKPLRYTPGLVAPQVQAAMETDPDGVPWEFSTTGKVVVVSMSQGFTGRLVKLLQQVDVIDDDENWIGGDSHLVYLGNLFGYGDSNLDSLYLLHKLSKQANDAGGRVHFLLGGTDFVNLRGLLSTMPTRSYEHLATDESQALIDAQLVKNLEQLWEYNADLDETVRESLQGNYENLFRRANQPGSMEFLATFAPGTEIGDWLRSINTVIAINGVGYVSGGLHPVYKDVPFDRLNTYHRNEINADMAYVPVMADVRTGPYIWRGLSFPTSPSDKFDVLPMLEEMGLRLLVVGHSPSQFGEIMLHGRVLHVDSNFMAIREQAAYNAVTFHGDTYTINNAGRQRELKVPPYPGSSDE